jgi:hypothetical protein
MSAFRTGLLAFLFLAPSFAPAQQQQQHQWPSDVRRQYIDECLKGCTANTSYTSRQRAECPPYCECRIREAQTFLPGDDAKALMEATLAGKPHPMKDRYEALSQTCAKRVLR